MGRSPMYANLRNIFMGLSKPWVLGIQGLIAIFRSWTSPREEVDPNMYFNVVKNQTMILVLYVNYMFLIWEEQ